MNIFIIVMNEPIYIGNLIRDLIKNYHSEIVGINFVKGNPSSVNKGIKKIKDIFVFILVLGLIDSLKIFLKLLYYRIRCFLSIFGFDNPYSIQELASKFQIPIYKIENIHSSDFLAILKAKEVDIIINQSQKILKKELLDIPKIGVVNRHASLLPKNRGLLAAFRSLYYDDKFSGVSIHFVDEKIDHGPIMRFLESLLMLLLKLWKYCENQIMKNTLF